MCCPVLFLVSSCLLFVLCVVVCCGRAGGVCWWVVSAVCVSPVLCWQCAPCVVGCGMAVRVGCVRFSCLSLPRLPHLLPSLSSFPPVAVGVRGSARAALRARTLSPNTIVFPLFFCFSVSSLPAFPCVWNGGVCLPCVGVLCWHDGYG